MAATPAHRASTGERINAPETTGRLMKVLGDRGIRLTRQRRVILQVMDDAEQHLDVDQIFERAKRIKSTRLEFRRVLFRLAGSARRSKPSTTSKV